MRKFIAFVIIFMLVLNFSSMAVIKDNKEISVSEDVIKYLEDRDIEVRSTTDFGFIELQNDSEGQDYALCITNYNNDSIQKDIFIFYTTDNEGKLFVDNTLKQNSSKGNSSFIINFPNSWSDDFNIHITASYTLYQMSYTRPLSLSWSYEKYSSNVNITYIDIKFNTVGELVTYPGFTLIGNNTSYLYTIRKNIYLPVENTVYSNNNSLSSNMAINTGSDGFDPVYLIMPGRFLSIEHTVNGDSNDYSLSF